jgi:hypothetical protein
MKKLIVALVLSFAIIGCSGGADKGSTSTPMPAKTGMSTPAPDASGTPAMEKTPEAAETPASDG